MIEKINSHSYKSMDQPTLEKIVEEMVQPCSCGSGKMAWQCHRADEAKMYENEMCPCGSGKMVKDCCMKNPDAHTVL